MVQSALLKQHHKPRTRIFRALFLLYFVTITPVPLKAQKEDQVLMIYSSTDIGQWEQIFNSTALQQLYGLTDTILIPEFLPLVDSSDEQRKLMAASLALQYQDSDIDIVVSVSPEAGTFIRQWSAEFAPGVRHLYVIPGNDILQTPVPPGSVILKSAVDIAAQHTLQLIQRLFPQVERLFVVGGMGAGDLSYTRRIERAIETVDFDIPSTTLNGLTPNELIDRLSNSSPNSAILLSTYDTDRTGRFQRAVLVVDLLAEQIDRPVFALFDTQVGRGALGGNVSSSALYAEAAVKILQSMLDGDNAQSIVAAPTSYRFDGEQLDRFAVDRNLLPGDSMVINDSPTYVRDNVRWIALALAVFIIQLLLIVLLLREIRSRKLAEEELKTTQKMEALGSLAGGIAHDFNNILMAIMANAELAKTTLNQPDKANTRLSNIISASNRAKGLISQILMFSRQAATRSTETVDVGALVTESAEQIRSFLPRYCELELKMDDTLLAVEADSDQIHQAIMNICINAQHAMHNEGTICLCARNTRFKSDHKIFGSQVPAGDYVSIDISDSGKGIRKDQLSHIFEPFFTTKPLGKGTGLGLALVYRIIRAHDGYIDVQSTPGEGTTFTVYLPACEQSYQAQLPAQAPYEEVGGGERILLVDDDEMVLDASRRTLEKLNYQVDAFHSSMQALKAVRAAPDKWDLLFTDLSMPEMDGVRLASQIRQLRPEIPVILYTGYLDAVDSIELANLRILNKPSHLDEIAQAVREAMPRVSKRKSR